jgi:hypothetical protein
MGCASFLFTDSESSTGTELVRVRIAGWSSPRLKLPNEEETRPKPKKQKPLLMKEKQMN